MLCHVSRGTHERIGAVQMRHTQYQQPYSEVDAFSVLLKYPVQVAGGCRVRPCAKLLPLFRAPLASTARPRCVWFRVVPAAVRGVLRTLVRGACAPGAASAICMRAAAHGSTSSHRRRHTCQHALAGHLAPKVGWQRVPRDDVCHCADGRHTSRHRRGGRGGCSSCAAARQLTMTAEPCPSCPLQNAAASQMDACVCIDCFERVAYNVCFCRALGMTEQCLDDSAQSVR